MSASTNDSSSGVAGAKRVWKRAISSSYSSRLSHCMTSDLESMPVLKAFWEEIALPSGVRGPVHFCAFRRFAAICLSVAIVVHSDWKLAHGVNEIRGEFLEGDDS